MRHVQFVKMMTFGVFVSCFVFVNNAIAQEGGQKRFGVVQNIAEDRQVERVGGIYEPEGLDKYMKRRFDAIDARLSALETQMTAMSAELLGALNEMKAVRQKSKILIS